MLAVDTVVFLDALFTIAAGRSSTGTTGTRIRASATGSARTSEPR
jgi:hypothetical protein